MSEHFYKYANVTADKTFAPVKASTNELRIKTTGTFDGATVSIVEWMGDDAPPTTPSGDVRTPVSHTSSDGTKYDIGKYVWYWLVISGSGASTDITINITNATNDNT